MTVYTFKLNKNNKKPTDYYINEAVFSHFGCRAEILRTKSNKPYLKDLPCFISVSHTPYRIFILISSENCGLDSELSRREASSFKKIIARYFSNEEKNLFYNLSYEEERKLFLELWVKKEAYLKFMGKGITAVKEANVLSCKGCFKLFDYDRHLLCIYSQNDITTPSVKEL